MRKKIIFITLLPLIALVFIFGDTKTAFGIDIYFPQTFERKVNQEWASLVEVTVLSNTHIEGIPQRMGWSDEDGYHYLLILQIDDVLVEGTALWRWSGDYYYLSSQIDDVMDDTTLWNWPSKNDEISIIAHSSIVLEEGQRYLAFISPDSLDERWIARISQDRSISAIPPLGIYFREYDGYTVEQLREIIAEIQSISITPTENTPPPIHVNDEITVIINGISVNFPCQAPVIVDGRALVPVRGVFEELDWDVDWCAETSTVQLFRNGFNIRITIGSDNFTWLHPYYTGNHYALVFLDVPAQIINGRTMLPIRVMLESVGYEVEWNTETRSILISTKILA